MPALGALSMLGRKSKKDKEKEEEDYRLIVNGNCYYLENLISNSIYY